MQSPFSCIGMQPGTSPCSFTLVMCVLLTSTGSALGAYCISVNNLARLLSQLPVLMFHE